MANRNSGAAARAAFSAALLSLALSGCWWNGVPSNGVLIRITSADSGQVQGGHPGACTINGEVVNHSENKIENIAFDLGGVHFETKMVHAGETTPEIQLANIDLNQSGGGSCSDIAQKIVADTSTPTLDCTMTGTPEGQCQKLTVVAVKMTDDDVKKVRDLEQANVFLEQQAQRLQQAPLPQALAELEKGGDDIIADFVIRTDAANWAVNRYDEGSAHVTKKSPVAGGTLLHAEYTYIGDQKGWVNITLYNDTSRIPCVEFWDFAGSCRDLRIPDAMKPAPPQAPAADAPPDEEAPAAAAPAAPEPAPAYDPSQEPAPAPAPDATDTPR
jgi:hypothetical protein